MSKIKVYKRTAYLSDDDARTCLSKMSSLPPIFLVSQADKLFDGDRYIGYSPNEETVNALMQLRYGVECKYVNVLNEG